MDIGALKGKKGMKGKGYHGGKGMFQRKGKEKDTRAKECTKDTKEKERAKEKAKEKDKDAFCVVIRTTGARNALKEKEDCPR